MARGLFTKRLEWSVLHPFRCGKALHVQQVWVDAAMQLNGRLWGQQVASTPEEPRGNGRGRKSKNVTIFKKVL